MPIDFPQFAKYQNLKYGFSTRGEGSMNRNTQKENRENYFRGIGINPRQVVIADLIHGSEVENVGQGAGGKMIQGVDGLVTNEKGLFLSATSADCFLVYFYDPVKQAVGIVHVGWRGLLAGVLKNTLEIMISSFGSLTRDILAGIGPGIRKCHFEISPQDKTKYADHPAFILERNGKIFIDLSGIINFQLKESNILEENITDSGICTYCNGEEYFSYRRDKPAEVSPMVGYIGLAT